jgi:hypothetical protein
MAGDAVIPGSYCRRQAGAGGGGGGIVAGAGTVVIDSLRRAATARAPSPYTTATNHTSPETNGMSDATRTIAHPARNARYRLVGGLSRARPRAKHEAV